MAGAACGGPSAATGEAVDDGVAALDMRFLDEIGSRDVGAYAWMAHPLLTLLAIVVTGNHYWIDAAVAGALVAAAVGWRPGGPWVVCNSVSLRRRAEVAAVATGRSSGGA